MGLFNKKKTQQNKKKGFVHGAFALGGAVVSAAIILPALLVKCEGNRHAGGGVDYANIDKALKPGSEGPNQSKNNHPNPSAFTYGGNCKVPVNTSTPNDTHPTGYEADGTTPGGDGGNKDIGNREYIENVVEGLTQNDIWNFILEDGITELLLEDISYGSMGYVLMTGLGLIPQLRITSIDWTEESPNGTIPGTWKALNYTVEFRLYGTIDLKDLTSINENFELNPTTLEYLKENKICDEHYKMKNPTQIIGTTRPLFLFGCNITPSSDKDRKGEDINFVFGNFSWKGSVVPPGSFGDGGGSDHINSITSKMRTDSMEKNTYVTNILQLIEGKNPEDITAIESDWVTLSIPLGSNPFPNFEFSRYANTNNETADGDEVYGNGGNYFYSY